MPDNRDYPTHGAHSTHGDAPLTDGLSPTWADEQLRRFIEPGTDLPEDLINEHKSVLLHAGDVVAGRFKIIDQVGFGGMGAVYKAHDEELDQLCALKVMLPSLLRSPTARDRFLSEIRISMGLGHPNIVRVHDLGLDQERGIRFFTMEFIEGKTLHRVLNENEGRLPVDDALEYTDQVCNALEYAHHQTIHRDLKPQNIMVGNDGSVKVLDFGLAKVMSTGRLTKSSMALGTAYYQAPEQSVHLSEVDKRADIYSVGVCLYRMVTGKIPLMGSKPASKVVGGVPKALDNVILQCLEPEPQDRYESATQLRQALRDCRQPKSRKTVVFAALALLAVLVVGGTLSTGLLVPAMFGGAVTVPDVTREDVEQAGKILAAAGLTVGDNTKEPSETVAQGYVIRQEPAANEQIRRNGTVSLTVSKGPPVTVPDLAKMTEEQARAKLEDLGLKPVVTDEHSTEVAKTYVISQNPQPGTEVDDGSKVELEVSLGPVIVPELVGLSQEKAEEKLDGNELELGEVTNEFDRSKDIGVVIGQDPAAGEGVDEDTAVKLTVASWTSVPSVEGKEWEEARDIIEDRGLTVNRKDKKDPGIPEGQVISQDPKAGERVDQGSAVKLVVSVNGPQHTFKYSAGQGGSLSGETEQKVDDGADGTRVEAVPDKGYHFVDWSDGSTDNPRTDNNVTEDIKVEAEFSADTYTVTFDAQEGTDPEPATIEVTYHSPYGTVATTEREPYTFDGWFTAPTGGEQVTETTDMTTAEDHTLYAQWTPPDTHTLSYTADANGSISGHSPQTVGHGSDGTPVEAVPDKGYHFVDWSDGLTDNRRTDTDVTANVDVTANFAINSHPHTLTYTAGPNGSIDGKLTQEVDDASDGSKVTAVPAAGYRFLEWSDGSTDNPRTDTNVTEDIEVEAKFKPIVHTLRYSAETNGGIFGEPVQTVIHGQDAKPVQALPDDGFEFLKWSDDKTRNPRTDTNITRDLSVKAQFIEVHTLVYTAEENGTLSGATQQTVEHSADGTPVEAIPNPEFQFKSWSDGSTYNPRTDTGVTDDIRVTAVFEQDPCKAAEEAQGKAREAQKICHDTVKFYPLPPNREAYEWEKAMNKAYLTRQKGDTVMESAVKVLNDRDCASAKERFNSAEDLYNTATENYKNAKQRGRGKATNAKTAANDARENAADSANRIGKGLFKDRTREDRRDKTSPTNQALNQADKIRKAAEELMEEAEKDPTKLGDAVSKFEEAANAYNAIAE